MFLRSDVPELRDDWKEQGDKVACIHEYGRTWLAAAGLPRRWWLLVFWDEPGCAVAAAAG